MIVKMTKIDGTKEKVETRGGENDLESNKNLPGVRHPISLIGVWKEKDSRRKN